MLARYMDMLSSCICPSVRPSQVQFYTKTAKPRIFIIIIIMTTCYCATQPVLSSAVQQQSLYSVAYRLENK